MSTEQEAERLRQLEKEVRLLRRKLERAEEQREVLEAVNDQNLVLMRTIRKEMEEQRSVIAQQKDELTLVHDRVLGEQKVSLVAELPGGELSLVDSEFFDFAGTCVVFWCDSNVILFSDFRSSS